HILSFQGTSAPAVLNTMGLTIADAAPVTGTTSLFKAGAATWVLSGLNSYTGITTINGGILSVAVLADGGQNSGIGASSVLATNLVINNGGVLQYTGSGGSTNHLIETFTTSAVLDAS